jgi:pyrroloquinoline-quinone synthase
VVTDKFFGRLDDCVARYDLLRHPFYQAWSQSVLTREDLQEYARDYYHHVESFPRAPAYFARRLPNGDLRRAVLENVHDELGRRNEPSHADLWRDFAEGVGMRQVFLEEGPSPAIKNLIHFLRQWPGNVHRNKLWRLSMHTNLKYHEYPRRRREDSVRTTVPTSAPASTSSST